MKFRYIIIPFLAFLLMSHNAFAVELNESVNVSAEYVNPYWRDNNSTTWINSSRTYSKNGDYSSTSWIMLRSPTNANISASVGEYYSFVGTLIATANASGQYNKSAFVGVSTTSTDCNLLDFDAVEVAATPTNGTTTEQRSVRYTITGYCRATSAISQGPSINIYTSSAPTSSPLSYTLQFHNLTKWASDTPISTINTRLNELSTTLNNVYSILGDILTDLNIIKDNAEAEGEAAQKELESTENIEDQTTEDISSSGSTENSETSSIIGVFSSFLSSLTNVQATTCIITLPFPSFAGGSWTWNICQNRDKAGNIMALFGSATLILFYVPVAWRLLAMIYNEIRSFTNG